MRLTGVETTVREHGIVIGTISNQVQELRTQVTELSVISKQNVDGLLHLERQIDIIRECTSRLEGSSATINTLVADIEQRIIDLKGMAFKYLGWAILALIIIAIGEKALDVVKTGIIK